MAGEHELLRFADGLTRLPERLYEQLTAELAQGRFAAGQRIPSEHALCTIYRVSRPVIREAIARLQADGLVVTRHGSGTFVTERGHALRADDSPARDVEHCCEVRMAIEGEAAYLAAGRWSGSDAAEIERAVPADVAPDNWGDRKFHLAILRTSRNPYLELALAALPHLQPASALSEARMPDAQRKAIELEHRGIAEAIRGRQGDLARERMRNHIEQARRRAPCAVAQATRDDVRQQTS